MNLMDYIHGTSKSSAVTQSLRSRSALESETTPLPRLAVDDRSRQRLADLTGKQHSAPIDRVASIDGQIDELLQDIDILAPNADDPTTDEFVAMSRLSSVDHETAETPLWHLSEGGLVLYMAKTRWI